MQMQATRITFREPISDLQLLRNQKITDVGTNLSVLKLLSVHDGGGRVAIRSWTDSGRRTDFAPPPAL